VAKVIKGIDVSDVEPSEFKQPTPGLYTMKIVEANYRDTDGKNDIELVLQVVGGEFDGSKLWEYVHLSEASAWKMREMLDAVGLPPKLDLDVTKLENKKVKAKVNGDQYQGEYRARVGRLAPLDASIGGDKEESSEPASEDASDQPWTEEELKGISDDELRDEVKTFELDVKTTGRGWKPKAIAAILEAQGEGGDEDDTNYEEWELADLVSTITEDADLAALLPGIEDNGTVSDDDKEFLAGFLHAADDGVTDEYLAENPWDEEGGEAPDYSEWELPEIKEEITRRGLTLPKGRKPKSAFIAILEKADTEDVFAS